VQTPILLSHSESVVSRNLIQAHRELHQSAIHCQEDVQHIPAIALAPIRITQSPPFACALPRHSVHALILWQSREPAISYIPNRQPKGKSKQSIVRIDRDAFFLTVENNRHTSLSTSFP
jgi:hypothetical protein